jgi:signal transduction histidine kinase
MFKQIGYRLAVQFTAFVFLLFLVNGAVFLIADFGNANRQAEIRLERSAHFITDRPPLQLSDINKTIPPNLRERIRVLDTNGTTLFASALFATIPFTNKTGITVIATDDERYNVLTLPILQKKHTIGFVQIAEIERFQLGDLPFRAFIYLFVSVLVSALTFAVGLFLAKRSLKPAAAMVEQLEQFTQDASHELRTPLAVLNSSLDLSLKTKKYKAGIESAKEDVKEISILVERLLELAGLDRFTLNQKTIDLTGLMRQTIEKYKLLATEKMITITATLAPNISIEGDEALVRQVIGNLLSNAIKFTGEHGTISVHLTKEMLDIEDTGIGIAQKEIPHIFDRFYQADTSRANQGFGLGLALVKRIVDLHGWRISVKSIEGKGATFSVEF